MPLVTRSRTRELRCQKDVLECVRRSSDQRIGGHPIRRSSIRCRVLRQTRNTRKCWLFGIDTNKLDDLDVLRKIIRRK